MLVRSSEPQVKRMFAAYRLAAYIILERFENPSLLVMQRLDHLKTAAVANQARNYQRETTGCPLSKVAEG